KKKQKEYILKELELSDHNKDDINELFNEIEYKSEEFKKIKSFASDNILTDDEGSEKLKTKIVKIESSAIYLVVIEEIPTKKKGLY
ncbi:1844_t:CDS:1, partial [Cetraspora pellucida]